MNLFINYYNAGLRQHEIDYCLFKNADNPIIQNIIVFNQHNHPNEYLGYDKITIIDVEKRPTYQDFFNATQEYPNDINIISNTDIFFDESLENANKIQENQCYAITRWEFDGEESTSFQRAHHNCPAHFSQDVWIFRGASKMQNCDTVTAVQTNRRVYDEIRFTIGIPGCDNVIAAKLKNQYQVLNPAMDILCHHYHLSKKRNGYTHRITGNKTFWGIINQGKLPITRI